MHKVLLAGIIPLIKTKASAALKNNYDDGLYKLLNYDFSQFRDRCLFTSYLEIFPLFFLQLFVVLHYQI